MKFLISRYKKTIQNTGIFLLLLAEIIIGTCIGTTSPFSFGRFSCTILSQNIVDFPCLRLSYFGHKITNII
jgi:hypothetical protein